MERPPARARFATACLAVAAGLFVLALLAPWRSLEPFLLFGAFDRLSDLADRSTQSGLERIGALVGLVDDPLEAAPPGQRRGASWAAQEGPVIALGAALFAAAALVLRRRDGFARGRPGARALALAAAGVALAGSLFASWMRAGDDVRAGFDGWLLLEWSPWVLLAVAVAVVLAAALERGRAAVAVLLPLAVAAVLVDDPAESFSGDLDHGAGAYLAAAALVVALIALVWPRSRRTL